LRTRSPDVNNRTVVGVISLGISDGDGTDSDRSANTSGGEGARIGVVVTSGNDGGNTGVDEVGDSFIEGRRRTTSQAQRDNSRTAAVVAGNPVNPRDDVGVGAAAIVTDSLDGDNISPLCNTAGLISAPHERETDRCTH
jgi:hypothetical protein